MPFSGSLIDKSRDTTVGAENYLINVSDKIGFVKFLLSGNLE